MTDFEARGLRFISFLSSQNAELESSPNSKNQMGKKKSSIRRSGRRGKINITIATMEEKIYPVNIVQRS